jgi:hypothetical protein
MFVLVNKITGAIFGANTFSIKSQFASERSAKAAATRYAKEFTENPYGRIVFKKLAYKVVPLSEYVEPGVTVTYTDQYEGTGPHTRTIGINDVGTAVDPRSEAHWSH